MTDEKESKPDNTNTSEATGQEWKLNFLKEKLNVTSAEIENAVSRVGNTPEKVEEFLKNRNTTAF